MYIKVLFFSSRLLPHILIVLMDQEDLIIPQVRAGINMSDFRADPVFVALHVLQFHRQQGARKIRTAVQF